MEKNTHNTKAANMNISNNHTDATNNSIKQYEEFKKTENYSRNAVAPNRVFRPTAVSKVDCVSVQCGLAWHVRT
eukprot:1380898-Pyramimonas_sp.AAC.1